MGSADVEALDRSFRSRVLLLGLLCVGGLGLAIWESTRDVGSGADEDPRRVLVVTPEQRSGDDVYLRLFDRAGFVAEVGGLVDLENRALEYVADSDAEGLALVLEFADLGGYGFVVLERPGEFDFGGIETDPPLADIEEFERRDYAVLSVGDLAFPHRLTVDDVGEDPVLRMRGHGALQAIYRQPRLDPEREILVERPTVDELKLEDHIERGRILVEAPQHFPQRIAQVVSDEREALDETGARALLEPLQTGSPLPVAGGGALLLHHELAVYSDDAQTLEIDAGDWLEIDWLSPSALSGGGQPEPCTSLHDGKIRLDRQPSFEVGRDGHYLAITALREGSRLWKRIEGDAGCGFTELGMLPPLGVGESHFGRLAPALPVVPGEQPDLERERAILARVQRFSEGGGSRLRVFSSSETLFMPVARSLLEVEHVDLHHPIFLQPERIACLGSPAPELVDDEPLVHHIHVVDVRNPGTQLRIPVNFLGEGWTLHDLAWVPGTHEGWNLDLVVHARDAMGRSHLVELSLVPERALDIDLMLAGGAASDGSPDTTSADDPPGLLTVAPDQLVIRELLPPDWTIQDFAVAPSGAELVLVVEDPRERDSELALLQREGGSLRMLTDNRIRDYLPRYTDEGQLLFSSLIQVSISRSSFTVPRVVVRSGS